MRGRAALLCILTLAGSLYGIIGAQAGPGAITIMVDDDGMAAVGNCGSATVTHDTIQEAVDAAISGDTIRVCPGTYPDPVLVDRTLEIQGAQAGVDARTRPGTLSAESVLDGVDGEFDGIAVAAPNVVISGFTFLNWDRAVGTAASASPALRVLDSIFTNNFTGVHIDSDNSLVRRSRFQDGTLGIRMVGGTKALFTLNEFEGNIVGILIEGGFCDLCAQGTPVVSLPADIRIHRNDIQGGAVIPTGPLSTTGIESEAATGLTITENTISGLGRGIWLIEGNDTVTIELNDVDDSTVALLLGFGPKEVETTGICCFGPNSNISVRSNRFTNGETGVQVEEESFTGNFVLSRNTISGNLDWGIVNFSGVQVNAAENWWGHASGPDDWSNGTGDDVSPDVRFFPWSTNATFTAFAKCKNTPTAANQTINGTTGNDILCGGGGQDTINGKAGNDLILGDAGSDILTGALGDDAILGGQGDDTLNGNAGFDSLQGQANNDFCDLGVDSGQSATCEGS